jgi:hypothetical protein
MISISRMNSRNLLTAACLVAAALPFQARAAASLTDLSGFAQDTVDSMVSTLVVGGSHRSYRPATNLGITGFDVGVDVTMISFPTAFTDALALGGTSAASMPTAFPVPRLNIHKGLPGGFDIGGSYIGLAGTSVIGFDAQWRLINNVALPAVSLRAGYTSFSSDEFFVKSSGFKFDVVASKNLFLIDPYIGAGIEYGSGELNVSTLIADTLPASVEATSSVFAPHIFVGVPLKLLFLQFVGEYDYSFTGSSTMGGKVSIAF